MAREGKISRILLEECIRGELRAPFEGQKAIEEAVEGEETPLPSPERQREEIIGELVEILLPSGEIQHQGRIYTDLVNREKKASTSLGHGIAVPHVRTEHARDLTIGFGKTSYPVDWDAIDSVPVDLFFVMVAPPFDDTLYNRIWPKLVGVLQYEHIREALRQCREPWEVIKIFKQEE